MKRITLDTAPGDVISKAIHSLRKVVIVSDPNQTDPFVAVRDAKGLVYFNHSDFKRLPRSPFEVPINALYSLSIHFLSAFLLN